MNLRSISCLTLALASARAASGQTVRENVSVEVITVRLTARDAAGKRIEDLKADDLVLKVDGRVVPIETFSALPAPDLVDGDDASVSMGAPGGILPVARPTDAPPLRIMVFVDEVESHPFDRKDVCAELARYLSSPGPADREFRVARYDGALSMDPAWTQDAEAVAATLLQIGAGGKVARMPGPGSLASEVGPSAGGSFFSLEWLYLHRANVAEALLEALAAFPQSPGKGRLLIVGGGSSLMRPGDLAFVPSASSLTAPLNPMAVQDERSRFRRSPAQTNIDQERSRETQRAAFEIWSRAVNPRGADLSADDVVAKALERDIELVPVFIEALSRGEFNLSSKTVDQTPILSPHVETASAMIGIAGDTGAEAITIGRQAAARLHEIENRAEYLLSFRDPIADHGQHRVAVTCRRPGVTLVYRRGYRIPEESERVLDTVVAGLRESSPGVDPMNVAITQTPATDSKKHRATSLRLAYDPPLETGASGERPVSVVAVGEDRHGNRTEPIEWEGTSLREEDGGSFQTSILLNVPPEYAWSVAVKDQPTGLTSYVLVRPPGR